MRTMVVAAGAIMVAAAAAVPYACGRILEQEVHAALDDYNKRQSFVTASVVSYDRQWLRSEFVTRLSIRDGAELARATTRVRHAPFTGLRFATGESEVHLAESSAATEQYYFEGRAPLTMSFDVEFGGGVSGVASTAPVDKTVVGNQKVRIVAGASGARFTMAKDKTFRFDWTLPKASYEDARLSLAVEGVAISAYGQLGDDDLSEPSGFKIAVASYRGAQGDRRASVRNFSLSTQMTPSAETLRFALAVRAGAGEIALDRDPQAWESLELACSVADVPKAPVIAYSAEVRGFSGVDASESQKMLLAMRAMSDLASGLAQGEPTFAVDKLELRTPQGNLSGSLRVGIDRTRASVDPASWTAADGLVMTGRASISRSLAVRLAGASPGGGDAAQGTIERLAARGVVRENGDLLEFDVSARDGVYMVNGVRASELTRM